MKKLSVTTLVALAGLALAQPASAHEDAAARYLGNEGVLVSSGDSKILFDAFYRQSYGQYALIDSATEAAMLAGEAPFDGVDAVLVSHVHGDHFSAAPAIAFLKAQPQVVLYGSAQVRRAIADELAAEDRTLLTRVVGLALRPGEGPTRIDQGSIQISVVAIPHAGGQRMADITNLAFAAELDGEPTIIHLGDADPNDRHFAPLQSYWDQLELDAAFPPYWFYSQGDGRLILSERLKATTTVGIHVPSRATGHGAAWREEHGGDLFTDPGEERKLIHREPHQ